MISAQDRLLVYGAGLGLRRDHFDDLLKGFPPQIGFMEVGPENWIDVGGKVNRRFVEIVAKTSLVCHGLSLNLGGQEPLDRPFLLQVKHFLKEHNVRCYSEHLSYCADEGHLYDLFPIPFTEEAITHVADRIKQTQDIIEQRIAVENVSYYAAPNQQMDEIEFTNAVLQEADCLLLLDINNIYVNSVNHKYDPVSFLRQLPADRIAYAHIAGHYKKKEDLCIDTHGADVIDPVWSLLDIAYETFGIFPTLLERDFDIPPLQQMLLEVDKINFYQQKYQKVAVQK